MGINFERKTDGAGVVITGLGAAFGNTDAYDDVIKKGAFSETLREWQARGKWAPMLLQHGGGFFGGGADDMVPIGQWTEMREVDAGLYVRGEVFGLETDRSRALAATLRSRALDGLSIGFRTRKSEIDETTGIRTITNIDLWELSIVTFPANDRARIGGVKSAADAGYAQILAALEERTSILRGDSGTRQADQMTQILAALNDRSSIFRTNSETRRREGVPVIERAWIHQSEEQRRGRMARSPVAASNTGLHAQVDALLAKIERIDTTYCAMALEEEFLRARQHVADLVARL